MISPDPSRIVAVLKPLLRLCACALAILAPGTAMAADPPFGEKTISISARGQDVRDFVADLFSEAGLNSKVSTQVRGQVQGVFRGNPREVWATISRAYNLVGYWDGSIMRIYSSEEVTSRSVPTYAPERLVADIQRQGMVDQVNTVTAGDGLVFATGVPEFLDRVSTMASSMRTNIAQAAPAIGGPATPASTSLASPLVRAPFQRASVRSQVLRPANGRSPFEIRIFFLTYRDAADREVRSPDRLTVIPGVATLLRELMGDGRFAGSVTSSNANEYDITGARTVRGRGSERFGRNRDFEAGAAGEEGGFEADLDGPRISADPTANAVIVRDLPAMMDTYEEMIASLDFEPLMVETQVTILELNVTELERQGFTIGFGLDGIGAIFGSGLSLSTAGVTGGYLSGSGDLFFGQINALQQRGAVRVVTRQVLNTPNNQVATFDISSEQLVRLQGEREVDAIAVSYGLGLRVRPSAIEDGGDMRIRLALELQDTGVGEREVDGVPVTGGAKLATTAIVRQGESVMLGGMSSNRRFDRRSRTPILGDIPLVGELFRSRRKGEDRVERLFLITPRVTNLGSPRVAQGQPQYSLGQLQGTEPLPGARQ